MKNSTNYFLFIITILLTFTSCGKGDDDEGSSQASNCEEFVFRDLDFDAGPPNCINFLFQVTDFDGLGIVGLDEDDFKVFENDNEVGSEAGVTIVPNSEIPYELKTVLLLDVSTSVENEIEDIKDAARSLVDNKASNQEIAIYTFSSETNLVVDFSSNITELQTAINNIEVGSSSTNLYGALVTASNLYQDSYNIQQIQAGNIVLFTDGDDTTGLVSQSAAISAMSDKELYIVALDGPDFDDDTREVMESFNPRRLLESSNASELEGLFEEILDNIIRLSQSTYRLFFSSPKRGNATHTLSLEFNCDDTFDSITRSFSSGNFTDGECTVDIESNYSCVSGNCQVDENGVYSSLADCQLDCDDDNTTGGFICVSGDCQTSENGTYATLAECQSQCGTTSDCGDTFTDPRDGEIYNIVTIGNQCWYADNVRYSGAVPQVNGDANWAQFAANNNAELPAWSYYNDDPSFNSTYGKLYNGYFASQGSLCPSGWRVPNDNDWQTLITFLGGEAVAGGKMKSTQEWTSPNTGATNSSGFSGLPGGYRDVSSGASLTLSETGFWWSSNNNGDNPGYNLLISNSAEVTSAQITNGYGFSCRCIKE